MECAICYEKFFTPKTEEEFKKKYKENVKNNNTHICPTPNCKCLICCDCWIKITHNGKNLMEAEEDDMPSTYDYFKCPYCRQIDWKYYMDNVFNELQKKLLSEEEFIYAVYKRLFPDFTDELDI